MNQIVWCRNQSATENLRNFDAFDQNQHFRFLWRSQHDDRHRDADWCKYDENIKIDCRRNCLHEMIQESRLRRKRTNQRRAKIHLRRDDQRSYSTTSRLRRRNSHVRKILSYLQNQAMLQLLTIWSHRKSMSFDLKMRSMRRIKSSKKCLSDVHHQSKMRNV
jgi:hypothetical protein